MLNLRAISWLIVVGVLISASVATARPFVLPVAATISETSKDGKGWLETGIARMTFVQAEGQFRATMAQSGWKYLHTVSLSSHNVQELVTWKKGDRELTLMLWRIDVGRTGFSWGLSRTNKNEE